MIWCHFGHSCSACSLWDRKPFEAPDFGAASSTIGLEAHFDLFVKVVGVKGSLIQLNAVDPNGGLASLNKVSDVVGHANVVGYSRCKLFDSESVTWIIPAPTYLYFVLALITQGS